MNFLRQFRVDGFIVVQARRDLVERRKAKNNRNQHDCD
jgi:hypothetical protein